MVKEAMKVLNPIPGGTYVDATIGPGGHSEAILTLIGTGGKLIGVDRDSEALKIVEEKLSDKRVILRKGNFSEMENLLNEEGITEVDGILLDLGISMVQMKDIERGLSFISNKRLDMRMDREQPLSAWDVVNRYPVKELERIFREFGEERLSRKIAEAIVRERRIRPIDTCSALSEIVERVYGGRGRVHPATKTFQALRIEVNKELEELQKGLNSSIRIMKTGGRLCVISYHSLEDRIVKHFIARSSKEGSLRVITKKPLTPGSEEIRSNPSSRSAKLRAAERI
jgi:16S rRNA (cytosine1402-N4)-methyltransferase